MGWDGLGLGRVRKRYYDRYKLISLYVCIIAVVAVVVVAADAPRSLPPSLPPSLAASPVSINNAHNKPSFLLGGMENLNSFPIIYLLDIIWSKDFKRTASASSFTSCRRLSFITLDFMTAEDDSWSRTCRALLLFSGHRDTQTQTCQTPHKYLLLHLTNHTLHSKIT